MECFLGRVKSVYQRKQSAR